MGQKKSAQKEVSVNQEITIDDLKSAIFAMESWFDAFGDEPEFEADANRIKKVMKRMREVLAEMEGPARPHLRLLPPPT